MKVSLNQVLAIHLAIKELSKVKCSSKWAYFITKNKGKIQNDIEGIAKAEEPMMQASSEAQKYIKENGEAGIDEKAQELIKSFEIVQKEHTEFLKTETDIDFHMIPFEEVPKEITQADFEALSIIIQEPK